MESIKAKGTIDELETDVSALFDLGVSLVGVNLGGMSVIGQSTGAPIMAAARGGQLFRKIFGKIPDRKAISVITEAAHNPRLAAALLEHPITEAEKLRLALQIHAYLFQAGIIETHDAVFGE